uniref:Single-stranded DNA-binding protein n=1 Tax=Steinernema glaseri TaxID=37863 RepID=A0A1I7Y7Y4_9BILA
MRLDIICPHLCTFTPPENLSKGRFPTNGHAGNALPGQEGHANERLQCCGSRKMIADGKAQTRICELDDTPPPKYGTTLELLDNGRPFINLTPGWAGLSGGKKRGPFADDRAAVRPITVGVVFSVSAASQSKGEAQ